MNESMNEVESKGRGKHCKLALNPRTQRKTWVQFLVLDRLSSVRSCDGECTSREQILLSLFLSVKLKINNSFTHKKKKKRKKEETEDMAVGDVLISGVMRLIRVLSRQEQPKRETRGGRRDAMHWSISQRATQPDSQGRTRLTR